MLNENNKNNKIIRNIMCIALFICMMNATATTYITDCIGLQNMQNNLTENYVLSNNIDCSDTINWNAGAGFAPVHDPGTGNFNGNLNGQNYNISDLYIYRPVTDYVGLFKGITTGTFKDIIFENVDITGQNYTGALASKSRTDVINITVIGNVTGYNYVGLIIGATETGSSTLLCILEGNVKGHEYTGGAIGFNEHGFVKNCYFNVYVNSTFNYAGGAIGFSSGNVEDCYSISNVFSLGDYVGGLIGETLGTIYHVYNSFATGNVTGASHVAGVIGFNEDLDPQTISNCSYNNHSANPSQCLNGGAGSCTAINDNEPYFYNVSNLPMEVWDFPPWSNYYDLTDFPVFVWQEPTPTPTPTPSTPPSGDTSDFTADMPTDYDVSEYEQQSGKDIAVLRGSVVYFIIIVVSLAGIYIFFAVVLIISAKAKEIYRNVK